MTMSEGQTVGMNAATYNTVHSLVLDSGVPESGENG